MGEITTIFTQYSFQELVLLIIIVLFALKAFNEVVAYFYTKIKNYFGMQNNKEQWEENVSESLNEIKKEIQTLKKENAIIKKQLSKNLDKHIYKNITNKKIQKEKR